MMAGSNPFKSEQVDKIVVSLLTSSIQLWSRGLGVYPAGLLMAMVQHGLSQLAALDQTAADDLVREYLRIMSAARHGDGYVFDSEECERASTILLEADKLAAAIPEGRA